MSMRNNQEKLRKLQEEQMPANANEAVVYVPDDCEEEDLLIGPIKRKSHEIIFGKGLTPPTSDFPYDKLKEMEQHLANSLRNVSFTTETKVWNCVLEELNCMRIAYHGIIDVSLFYFVLILAILKFLIFIFFSRIFTA